jgi:hypothetical protein
MEELTQRMRAAEVARDRVEARADAVVANENALLRLIERSRASEAERDQTEATLQNRIDRIEMALGITLCAGVAGGVGVAVRIGVPFTPWSWFVVVGLAAAFATAGVAFVSRWFSVRAVMPWAVSAVELVLGIYQVILARRG